MKIKDFEYALLKEFVENVTNTIFELQDEDEWYKDLSEEQFFSIVNKIKDTYFEKEDETSIIYSSFFEYLDVKEYFEKVLKDHLLSSKDKAIFEISILVCDKFYSKDWFFWSDTAWPDILYEIFYLVSENKLQDYDNIIVATSWKDIEIEANEILNKYNISL